MDCDIGQIPGLYISASLCISAGMDVDARVLVEVMRDTGVRVDVQRQNDGTYRMTAHDGSGHAWQVTAVSQLAAAQELKRQLWHGEPE